MSNCSMYLRSHLNLIQNGLTQPIIKVIEFPDKESFSILVNFESLLNSFSVGIGTKIGK